MPVDSANRFGCMPNGKPSFNPGIEGSNPSRPSRSLAAIVKRTCADRGMSLTFGEPINTTIPTS